MAIVRLFSTVLETRNGRERFLTLFISGVFDVSCNFARGSVELPRAELSWWAEKNNDLSLPWNNNNGRRAFRRPPVTIPSRVHCIRINSWTKISVIPYRNFQVASRFLGQRQVRMKKNLFRSVTHHYLPPSSFFFYRNAFLLLFTAGHSYWFPFSTDAGAKQRWSQRYRTRHAGHVLHRGGFHHDHSGSYCSLYVSR